MTARAHKPDGRRLKTFGWQGINLTVPHAWELVASRGSYEAGYASLEDEADVRLEVKWESPGKKASPSEVAGRYIQELRKKAKKDRTAITVRRDVNLAAPKGCQTECYEWTAAVRGAGMVSHCDGCHRLVHLVVLAMGDEPLRKLARTVFSSLRDHSEDDQVFWSFYDVQFSSPRAVPLQRQELKTGCVRMHFQKRHRRIEFVRVSLARIVLAGKSLIEWFKDFYVAPLKRYSYEVSESQIGDHPGVVLEGRPWLIVNPGRLLGRPRQLRVACWHCEASNRLFVVRHDGPRAERSVFDRVTESVKCCPER